MAFLIVNFLSINLTMGSGTLVVNFLTNFSSPCLAALAASSCRSRVLSSSVATSSANLETDLVVYVDFPFPSLKRSWTLSPSRMEVSFSLFLSRRAALMSLINFWALPFFGCGSENCELLWFFFAFLEAQHLVGNDHRVLLHCGGFWFCSCNSGGCYRQRCRCSDRRRHRLLLPLPGRH